MSDSTDWVLNALRDIEHVCKEAGLEKTSAMLKQTLEIAVTECRAEPKVTLRSVETSSDFMH